MTVPVSYDMHYRATWSSGAVYHPGDLVVSSGSVYVCKKSVAGTTAPASDSTHWDLLCSVT